MRIPLSVPNVDGDAWAYVKECLHTGWASTAGPGDPVLVPTLTCIATINADRYVHDEVAERLRRA